ncbi:MAG: MBL fold metallo-hydrolase [Acidobacteria bacterium]|nr:MBL fold metallo-hydrolase [Acidobacteriota bacterium]
MQNFSEYLKVLDQEKWRLAYLIDTHTHADHLSGSPALCDHLQAPYVMHEVARPQCVTYRVKDGDLIKFGDVSIACHYTPGHTNDSLTLVVEDCLLTGDSLFIGKAGAGRTDLPTGDPGEHFESLQRLRQFPDHFQVFPGHDYPGGLTVYPLDWSETLV